MNIIIPLGGIGKRFNEDGYNLPKPLIKSLGKSILFWNIENLNIDIDDIIFIVYREEFKVYNFENLLQSKFRNHEFRFISIKNDTRGASETILYALQSMNQTDLKKLTIVIDSDNFYQEDIIGLSKKINSNLIFYKKDFEKNPIYSYILIDEFNKVLNIEEKNKISDFACVGAYCFKSGELLKNLAISVIKENKKQKNEFYISSLYKSLIETNEYVFSKEINDFTCLGTPNQLKTFSSNFNLNHDKLRFCFDLDNTLVSYPEIDGDYSTVKPLQNTINFSNFLYSSGHTIIIYTARRMKTYEGNIGKVQADIAQVTIETLNKFGIKYHELFFGKPYANFYIDDLSLKPFEDLEKATGFYNIHPETRSHNKIEIFDNYLIKYSDKIGGEKFFYENIPNEIKYLFPTLIDSGENFIKISKISGIPFSFLNVSNTLTIKLLQKLLNTLNILHSSPVNTEVDIYQNYSMKLNNRLREYDFSNFEDFEKVISEILIFLKFYEKKTLGKIGLIHGDPVLSNIIIDSDDNIKFIDMRGKVGNRFTVYGDVFYDYSKIYQSLIGYDHVLMDKDTDEINIDNRVYFENFIINNFNEETLFNIKQITKSLIISLIPLHNNHKCKKFYELLKKI